MVQSRERNTNIELLRIVAMLLIMFGHSHLRMLPMTNFFDVLLSCVTTTGVGIFIAISGWFGIRFKKEGLFKFLFQVLFTLWFVYALAISLGVTELNMAGVMISLTFFDGYWFILGYLGIYLFSPILNSFIEHSTKRKYQIVLISYFLFQSYCSWLSAWYDYYGGYSIILFGGIYLTAAYLRKYPIAWIQKNAPSLWLLTILLMTVIASLSLWRWGHAARMIRDDNPLVIMASVLLLLSFNKLHFHSKVINWLAASCFAVYLIHYSPFVYPYLMQLVRYVYGQFDGLIYGLALLFALSFIYFACTLFDQIRVLFWNLFQRVLLKNE